MSSRAIKRVAVVGASGNIGPAIVNGLTAAGFNVTVIVRAASTTPMPTAVPVHRVDLSSKADMIEILRGQDAVVSVLSRQATASQLAIIDAAAEAGVSRFIPSEFGIDTRHVGDHKVSLQLRSKIQTVDYLSEVSKKHPGFTWTALAAGVLFDWGLNILVGVDVNAHTLSIVDSGNEKFSPTTLPQIARAVASTLKRPEETANKYLTISSFTTTQNDVARVLEKESGIAWIVKHTSSEELERSGDEKAAKGDPRSFIDYLRLYSFGDGGRRWLSDDESANELLGLAKEDLASVLRVSLGTAKVI